MIGECGDEGDSGWGYGQGPSECSGGIDKRDIDSDSAQDGDRNDKLGGNADGWMGGEPVNYLQSTRTLLVGEHVLRQTLGGKTRRKCWRRKREWIGR